jgi:hypothetical protein
MNIVSIIETNPLTKLNHDYQNKFIQKIQRKFSTDHQQLFIGSFYGYLNYDSKTDFIIKLNDIWKWLGFSRIDNAKKVLTKHFIENDDYKVTTDAPAIAGASLHGGQNKENILMNLVTFKKLCLKSNTKKADSIHNYFIELEEVLQEIVNEESNELKNQLSIKEHEIQEKDKLIEEFENKPDTEGFHREAGEVYCIIDTTKKGHVKIGMGMKSISRVNVLNVGSSTQSLKLYTKFETFDKVFAEKLIHSCLNPFRIKNRNEWFYFKNDLEMAYAMNTIKKCLDYIKSFDIKDYNHFKDINKDLNIQNELLDSEMSDESKKLHDEELEKYKETITLRNIHASHQGGAQTGHFKGVCWSSKDQLWLSQIQHNHKHIFLGYSTNEIDGAQLYNDHAAFLNETENTDYKLNDIPGYKTVARNIVDYNKKNKQDKQSSKYNGVSYDSRRKHFVANMQISGKTYNLGNNLEEVECAKLWNQQAAHFNNTINTKYILNEIENYITIPKNIHQELVDNKLKKKKSKYQGVTFDKQKWCSYYTLNRKNIHIGRFDTELEACLEYNKAVAKLNEHGCNYKINEIELV